jgi:predicted phage terminase large subunit-like protein
MINISTQDLKKYIYNQVEKKTIEKAKNDFHLFATLMSKEFDPLAKMNFETYKMSCEILQAFLENRLFELKNNTFVRSDFLFFLACPSWGKSYVVTRLLNIWWFAKENLAHFVITANEKNRKRIMYDIPTLLNLSIFNKIFPDFELAKNNDGVKISKKGGWLNMNPARSDITGTRGDLFIFDDFDKPTHMNRAEFNTSKDFLNMYLTRGFKNKITKNIVVMQRVDKNDTTGYLQDIFNQTDGIYSEVKIPYKFTENTTYTFYIKNKITNEIEEKKWIFPAETFSNCYFDEIKWNGEVLGKECQGNVSKRETQYQQNPQNRSGVILPFDYVNHRYEGDPSMLAKSNTFRDIIISADTSSGKNKNTGDNSCFTVAGLRDGDIYVLEVVVGKFAFHELKNVIEILYFKYKPNYFFIEDKSSGESLIQEFKNKKFVNPTNGTLEQISIIATMPKASKEDRLEAVKYFFANGKVKIPEQAKWVAEWQYELSNFPNTKHDDRVDSITHLLLEVKKRCLEVPSVVISF